MTTLLLVHHVWSWVVIDHKSQHTIHCLFYMISTFVICQEQHYYQQSGHYIARYSSHTLHMCSQKFKCWPYSSALPASSTNRTSSAFTFWRHLNYACIKEKTQYAIFKIEKEFICTQVHLCSFLFQENQNRSTQIIYAK